MTKGPWLDLRISTPQTLRPVILAALTAVDLSSGVNLTRVAEPPR